MRDLINLIEAPAQGKTGAQLAKTSGGQFMNRADRTNQAKVDAALGGTVNPATGKPYVAGTAAANMALAKKFSQPQTATAAPAPATNVRAPSAGNELVKGQVIGNAMNPAPVADTRGAAAMASKSAPVAPEPAAAPAQTSDQIATQALNAQDNTPAADTRGAAAMASKSAPVAPEPATQLAANQQNDLGPEPRRPDASRTIGGEDDDPSSTTPPASTNPAPTDQRTSDQIATAALNAQDSAPVADTRGAAAMASRSNPTDVRGAAAQRAAPAPEPTTRQPGSFRGTEPATAATSNPAPAVSGTSAGAANNLTITGGPTADKPASTTPPTQGGPAVTGGFGQSTNISRRTPDQIAADMKAGPGGQNQATKSYGSAGEFFSAIGDKFKGMFGGNQPVDAMANSNAGDQTTSSYNSKPVSEEELDEEGMTTQKAPSTQPNKTTTVPPSKLPTPVDLAKDAYKSNQDLENKQPETYPDAYKPAPNTQSKSVNTVADFEESVDRELAEMLRLSGLPIMEKSVSKQQQKFMGMVHAMQKGEKVKGASPELKKAAKTMSKKDARDFAKTKHKGLPQKVNEGLNLMLDEDGHTLTHIVNRYKHEVRKFIEGEFMPENLYDALYDYYMDIGDMPYGVAKGREGDPYQWVSERFYDDVMRDLGNDMNEAVQQPVDNTLNELARLAGITNEDGPGAAMLYSKDKSDLDSFGDKLKSAGKSVRQAIDKATLPKGMHADYDRIEAEKDKREADAKAKPLGEWGDSPLDRIGKSPKPQSPGAAEPFAPRERERVVSPKVDKYDKDLERAEKTRRWIVDKESPKANEFGRTVGKAISEPIAAIKSAWHGATDAWDHTMGNDTAPDPKPPVSVVKKSDWKGDKDNPALKENDELNRMRKIAGLKECGDMEMDHNDNMSVSTNMSSDGTKSVNISAQGDRADDLLQMLKMAGMRPHDDHSVTMSEPEVIMISGDQMMDEERETEYENTPEEEYQTVDSIIRQGNDLNREKRQYADRPKLGDNPMAESILDQDLNEILESILIRDDKDETKITTDPKTGRVSATYPPPKKPEAPDQSKLPLEKEPYHGPRHLSTEPEKTGTEKEVDEGTWDDIKTGVSNTVGDLFNTDDSIRRRSQQYRDLEAMQQQYKPGTPEHDQLEKRKGYQKERYYADKGEVVGKDGEPIKVLPPDQWKGN